MTRPPNYILENKNETNEKIEKVEKKWERWTTSKRK